MPSVIGRIPGGCSEPEGHTWGYLTAPPTPGVCRARGDRRTGRHP